MIRKISELVLCIQVCISMNTKGSYKVGKNRKREIKLYEIGRSNDSNESLKICSNKSVLYAKGDFEKIHVFFHYGVCFLMFHFVLKEQFTEMP